MNKIPPLVVSGKVQEDFITIFFFCGKIFGVARVTDFLFLGLCFLLAKRELGCYNSGAL